MDENWRLLYREMINDKRFYADKAWETIKFFTTIYTAILSITILLVIHLYDEGLMALLIIFLPISAMVISCIGWLNLRRENARAYETMATLMKVEKLLGFHEDIKEVYKKDNFFEKDKYVLPTDFVEINENVKSEGTREFIDWMFKRQEKNFIKTFVDVMQSFIDWIFKREKEIQYGKFYSRFTWLFRIYAFIAIWLIIIIALVYALHI